MSRGNGFARRSDAGLTLFEVTLVIVVLAMGLSALTTSIATSSAAKIRIQRQAEALDALQQMAETIRRMPIETVVGTFAPQGTLGPGLSIPGLDGSELAGRITLVVDETATDSDVGIALGMPRDLDGDGLATNTDVTATALSLPVVIEAAWSAGNGTIERLKMPVVVFR